MEAETILTKIRNLISALETDANPIPIKYALSLLGIGNGEMRLPLMKLNEKNQETVKEFLAENIFNELNIYDVVKKPVFRHKMVYAPDGQTVYMKNPAKIKLSTLFAE